MSLYDFEKAVELNKQDYPFSSLIMAAIIKADSFNSLRLKQIFPELWEESFGRYNSPGGKLPGE